MTENIVCNFVIALDCEARSIINFYKLKRIQAIASHVVYVNADDSIYLIVSGIGMKASQSAVDFLAGWQLAIGQNSSDLNLEEQRYIGTHHKERTIWLNIGMAGHVNKTRDTSENIGSIYRVNKVQAQCITNQANPTPDLTASFYPVNTIKSAVLKSQALMSCYNVMDDYQALASTETINAYLIDMEGAGFISAAKRYGSMELIQLIKIVSDNADNPIKDAMFSNKNNKREFVEFVESLLQDNMVMIDRYYQQLKDSIASAMQFEKSNSNDELDVTRSYLMSSVRFSRTQSVMLQNLLQSLYVRNKHTNKSFQDYIASLTNMIDHKQNNGQSKQMLALLERELKELEWSL